MGWILLLLPTFVGWAGQDGEGQEHLKGECEKAPPAPIIVEINDIVIFRVFSCRDSREGRVHDLLNK